MSAEKAPLVNKLILLVLVLILGCLAALVVQNSRKESVSPYIEDAVISDTVEPAASPPANPVHYSPVTNRVVSRSTGPIAPRPAIRAPENPIALPRQEQLDFGGHVGSPVFVDPHEPGVGIVVPVGEGGPVDAQISGEVWLTGKPPPEIPINFESTCGKLHIAPVTTRHYVVTEDGRLANVFVYIKDGLQKVKFPLSTNEPTLNNINCQFEPYVMGVQAGQKFLIENSDPILHNVNNASKLNRGFNIGLSRHQQRVERSFSVPEVMVRLKCDVHPWMFAYIGVVSHPFFAVTDKQGVFRFPRDLPPGRYVIAAYHLKAGEVTQEITVHENETKVLRFDLAIPRVAMR